MKKVKIICVIVALLLVFGAIACFSTFKKGGEAMMTISDGEIERSISLNTYKFLLSRMKGTLDFYGYDVEDASFWRTVITSDGKTWDEHFSSTIFEQTKLYLIVDYLFELEGLTLDAGREAKIDETMQKMTDAAGSATKLNSTLKDYGVNAEMLREIYITEQKFAQLIAYYYGENGEKIDRGEKDKYYSENYVAFGQIFLPTYELVDGKAVSYDAEAKAEVLALANQYAEECSGRLTRFTDYCGRYSAVEGSGDYTYLFVQSEYYAFQDESVAYLDTIASTLSSMAVGECRVIASPYGYHVICRYEREAGAYDNEKYAESFSDFYPMLSDKLFDQKCAEYADNVTVISGVTLPKISEVSSNKLY